MTITVLVDLDGVVADFDGLLHQRCAEQGIPLDIGGPDEQTCRFLTDHATGDAWWDRARAVQAICDIVETPGWFRELPLMPGAQEGVAGLVDCGYDVWFVTKPLEANPLCGSDKYGWVCEHFPDLKGRLVLAPDKSMVRGDLLIDDAPKMSWLSRADWRPVVFDRPYNREDSAWGSLPLRWSWDRDPSELYMMAPF